jgi:hypothetical protein
LYIALKLAIVSIRKGQVADNSAPSAVRGGQDLARASGRRCAGDRCTARQSAAAHRGKIYHLTGPQFENMHFLAQEYSKALGRTITFQDIPVEPSRDELLKRGWPVHVVNHLAAMGDLHRAGRFDRLSDDGLMLTGQRPLSVQEFVRKNAATFAAWAKAKQAWVFACK